MEPQFENTTVWLGHIIGSGSFGIVYLTEFESRVSAVKVVEPKTADTKRLLMRELSIHKGLVHKNIVELFTEFSVGPRTYIVMEYCSGGTLRTLVDELLTFNQVRRICLGMIEALLYLHECLIAHCDIKIDNVLISETGDVKLCDFGFAIQLGRREQRIHGRIGSMNYMAPEIVLLNGFSLCVDVWAMIVVVYRLIFGVCPFKGETKEMTYENIELLRYEFPVNVHVDDCFRELIQLTFVFDERRRPTLKQIRDELVYS
jgi:serine/threonine protein kinase